MFWYEHSRTSSVQKHKPRASCRSFGTSFRILPHWIGTKEKKLDYIILVLKPVEVKGL